MSWRPLVLLVLLAGAGVGALGGCGPDKTTTTTRTVVRTVSTPTAASGTSVTGGIAGGATGATGATSTVAGTESVTSIGSTGSSGIIRPFASNSPWNTTVQGLDVDPNSARMMRLARLRVGATDSTNTTNGIQTTTTRRRDLNFPLFINRHRWTVPVVDETNGVDTPTVCRQPPLPPKVDLCGDGWTVSSLLVPGGDDPHPEFDGWYTVLSRRAGFAYDLWRARRAGDGTTLSYQFMRRWDLSGPGFLQPGIVSARGSGLPLFAGLILPEEIQAGRIDHALAISVPAPAQRNYVQPASSTDGTGRTDSLPEGARIRLKAGVTLRSIQRRFADPRCANPLFGLRTNSRRRLCAPYSFPGRTNQVAAAAVITALHRYGAIVVDRAVVPTLYAKFNADWSKTLRDDNGALLDSRGFPFQRGVHRERTPLLRGNELQGIRLSDFEVVKLGPLYKFPSRNTQTVAPLPGGAVGQTAIRPAGRTTTPSGRQTFQPSGGGGGG